MQFTTTRHTEHIGGVVGIFNGAFVFYETSFVSSYSINEIRTKAIYDIEEIEKEANILCLVRMTEIIIIKCSCII